MTFLDGYIVGNTKKKITDKLKAKNENNEYAGRNINYRYSYDKETKKLKVN